MSSATDIRAQRRDALAERLLEGVLGTIDVHTVYVGDRLGLYRELAKAEATAGELAARTRTAERYVREWLEQQAVAGLLDVDEAAAPAERRRYRLPPGHAEVLVDRDDPAYSSAFARMVVGMVRPLPRVLEAFRSGGGVPYADYDADFCDGQGETNRVQFLNLLGSQWLPALPDVDARLRADPPARVADVACGTGWSTIAIAEAYPKVHVHGIDVDPYSIEVARRNAAGAGLDGRVRFEIRDASEASLEERFDLACAFGAVHDMARPVEALRGIRGLLAAGGSALVAEERVAERFAAPGDDVERLMYGVSVLHSLPTGLAAEDAAAMGAALRPGALRALGRAAGFRSVEALPIEHHLWRFYRLLP